MLGWTALQSALGLSGFYQHTTAMPPRILLFGVLPTLVFIIVLFNTKGGRKAIDALDLRTLTWLHTVRIPVEIVLWLLVERQLLSPSMSVGGTNFDVIGPTAPLIATVAFRNGTVNKRLLMMERCVPAAAVERGDHGSAGDPIAHAAALVRPAERGGIPLPLQPTACCGGAAGVAGALGGDAAVEEGGERRVYNGKKAGCYLSLRLLCSCCCGALPQAKRSVLLLVRRCAMVPRAAKWKYRTCGLNDCPAMRLLYFLTLLGSLSNGVVVAQPNYVPDPQLRTILNNEIPGLVGADGYITQPGAQLNLTITVNWGTWDLTGLEFLQVDSLAIIWSSQYPTGYSTPFPKAPRMHAWTTGAPHLSPAFPTTLRTLTVALQNVGNSALQPLPAGLGNRTCKALY